MSQTLLVTGASGQFGRLVLDSLLHSAEPGSIVAATRDPSKLDVYAAQGVQVRQADFDAPDTLDAAFAGVDRVLIVSTDALGEPGKRLGQHKAAVAAALRAGVKHVVYTSMPAPETSAVLFAPDHLGTEQAIKASGVGYTILRNGWYMENLFMALPAALASGQWYTSAGEGRIAHVARADEAAAAAAALASATTESAVHTLTGGEALTTEEIAALVREVAGRPLAVVQVTDEQLGEGMKAAGVPEFLVPTLVSFDRNTREGHIAMVTGDIEKLTGRKPQTLKTFLEANLAALTAQAA
ncbi:MAG: SDR family oxidoreductase [Pseudomonadota bacterium]|nr:SDR family oxidoreductase [Pseudomonadota bacterium]